MMACIQLNCHHMLLLGWILEFLRSLRNVTVEGLLLLEYAVFEIVVGHWTFSDQNSCLSEHF